MDKAARHFYEFDTYQVDVEERQLLQNGNLVQLTPKVFDILLALVENCGHTLTKDELMQQVWADSFVEEGNLNRNVSTLRKVLGDDPLSPRFIKTTPKRGYAFVGEVNEIWESDETVTIENRTRYHLKVSEQITRVAPLRRWSIRFAAAVVAVAVFVSLAWVWNQTQRSDARELTHEPNFEARELYEKGRSLWQTRAGNNLHEATVTLEEAVRRDPNFALAHAALADAYAFDYANWKKAEAAANEAIRLDPSLGEPHASIGFVRMFWEWKLREAENEFKRAIELNPNYATAHQWYAVLLAAVFRHDAALAEMNTALDLEPESPSINTDLCQMLYLAGSYDNALAQCKKSLEMQPNFYNAHRYLYEIYSTKEMYDEAVGAYLKLEELDGNQSQEVADLRDTYAASGIRAFWTKRAAILAKAPTRYYQLAQHMARLGEKDDVIKHLRFAFERREPDFLLFYTDPAFDAIRTDPRFDEMINLLYPMN